MKLIRIMILCAMTVLALPTNADEVRHFKGVSVNSVEDAQRVLNETNRQFRLLLESDLTAQDLHDIHELSYSMENALGYLNQALASVAETLEAVHKGSEYADASAVREEGVQYLNDVEALFTSQ